MDGNYTSDVGLLPGTYYVVTYNSSHYFNQTYNGLPCPYGCDPTEGLAIIVGDADAVSGIDFSLERGGWISGSIVDETTGAGFRS